MNYKNFERLLEIAEVEKLSDKNLTFFHNNFNQKTEEIEKTKLLSVKINELNLKVA